MLSDESANRVTTTDLSHPFSHFWMDQPLSDTEYSVKSVLQMLRHTVEDICAK
jgi:hypothetical protein